MNREKAKSRVMQKLFIALCIVFSTFQVALATTADDVVPFFAGHSGMPNVMILFDNSDSMQDSPYRKKDGNAYRPKWWSGLWTRGVVPTADNDPTCTAGAPCIQGYSNSVHRIEDDLGNVKTEMTLPGQNPPNLPGLFSNASTVTPVSGNPVVYHGTDCPAGIKCSDRIYDADVAWGQLNATKMAQQYANWKVRVTEKSTGAIQERTLTGFGSGYWVVSAPDLQYKQDKYYVYEIVVGQPGEVTAASSHKDRVYDRNFNWRSVINDRDFDPWIGQSLTITSGTNAGESQTITGRNVESGYWEVSSDFTASCDMSSKYNIQVPAAFVTGILETRRANGGDHPASKMYQAKKALQKFLTSDKIKSSYTNPNTGVTKDRYSMNVGFASFMQALVPKTVSLYYRKIEAEPPVTYTVPKQFYYKLRYRYQHSKYLYQPTGCSGGVPPASVTFDYWGTHYSNITNNGTISRSWTASNCSTTQTLCYKVNISCSPTDANPNRVRIHLDTDPSWPGAPPAGCASDPDGRNVWGATEYSWHYINAGANATCTGHRPTLPWGDAWVNPGDQCYEPCGIEDAYTVTVPGKVAYYKTTWRTTTGDLREQDPNYGTYIDRSPGPDKAYMVTPYPGYSGGSWSVKSNPDPEPASGDGDYTLLTSLNEKTVPVCRGRKSDGTCSWSSTLLAKDYPIADNSYFQYPGRNGSGGTPAVPHSKRPHGWSYKKTALNPAWTTSNYYRHKFDGSYTGSYFNNNDLFIYAYSRHYPSVWGDSIQRPVLNPLDPSSTYYPALTGNDFSNYFGEDQVFFVNLPKYDTKMYNFGDDYEGDNVNRILNRINLGMKQWYYTSSYVSTMAPGNPGSLAVSSRSAETGNGTPIAATLRDARKYFESYIRQDPLSKEGCRKNFIILLTDGTETTNEDPVAEAANLWGLHVDGKATPVRVFVIGFGLGANEKAALNAIAAAGGPADALGNPATAYFASNIDELVTILSDEIGSLVTAGSYSRAKAGLPKSGSRASDGLTVYSAFFDYPGWRGHLQAYDVYQKDEYDAFGNLTARAGDIKGSSAHWATGCSGVYATLAAAGTPDAGCIMAEDNTNPDSSNRTLYTTVDVAGTPTSVNFVPTAIDGTATGNALKDALIKIGGVYKDIDENGVANDADAKAVISYVHHPGYDGAKYVGTRTKEWPLADIYDSSPVVVSAPYDRGCIGKDVNSDGTIDKSNPAEWNWDNMTGYCQYNYDKRDRKAVVYFGTNGGMIEAITTGRAAIPDDPLTPVNESVSAINGGEELWGYIPEFVLPKLNEFKIGHRFTMDLDVLAAEVDTSAGLTGTGWKTILVAGQRKGGNNYVALDVTDPDNPDYLWTFTDANLGATWSRPSVARLEINGVRTSVFIFGGGYSTAPNVGNRIYIVRASDGVLLKEITVGGPLNNVPARLTTMRYNTDGIGQVVDYRTNAIAGTYGDGLGVDSDRRDFIEVTYFGDTDGNIWRLEGLNTDSGGSWNPKVFKLYEPDSTHAQPIYHMLKVVDRRASSPAKRFILGGTGDENNPVALKDGAGRPLFNYFFEIEEDTTSLVDITDESKLNWRMTLGKRFPRDKYGFLLKPDNSGRYTHGGKEILSSYIFILKRSEYNAPGSPWAIDANNHLTFTYSSPARTVLAAVKGEYLFDDGSGNLYENPNGGSPVATAGSYMILDFAGCLTNKSGDFYNSADGSVIIPKATVDQYYYDNDGFWCDGSNPLTCSRRTVDGNEVQIVTDMGEKMLTDPDGYGEQVYFMTYTPTGGCGVGQSYFYGVKASQSNLSQLTGGTGLLTHGPGTEDYTETRHFRHNPQRKVGLGRGIANFTLGGKTAFIGQEGGLTPLPIPVSQKRLRYWKQN